MREPLRVVIDTNHIMSALLSSSGASAKLVNWIAREDGDMRLLISPPIWNEYLTVAAWLIPEPRKQEQERVFGVLSFQAEWIIPTIRLNVCRDVSDNRFLECAVAAGAHYLVTKNIHHFPPKEYEGVKIVRIRKFLEALERMAKK